MQRMLSGVFFIAFLFTGSAHADAVVEQKVRDYFADTPVMIEIARCESKFRQYADSGNPLYGGAGGAMVGVFQIHGTVHQSYARSVLGYDIATLEGNLGYAKYLYQTEGTKPWASSYACWRGAQGSGVSTPAAAAPGVVVTAGATLTVNLSFAMVHPQVLALQKLLNQKGFIVATEGPGSPGQETEMFGSLTRVAVRKFQCTTLGVCDGDEQTTGYGRVGPRTRAAITSASSVSTILPMNTPAAPAPTSTPTSTPSTSSSGGGSYTPVQQAEVTQLQAQIEELTTFLELYQTGEQQP